MKNFLTLFLCFIAFTLFAQKNTALIRGNVYDKNGGQPVPYANVLLRGTIQGATTDANGFYQISNVKPYICWKFLQQSFPIFWVIHLLN